MPVYLLAFVLLAQPPGGTEYRTKHYDLYSETGDAFEQGRLLEALHGHLRKHFEKAPDKRLRVRVYANVKRFRQALAADGLDENKSGGFYSFKTKIVYLYQQPSAFYTRQLLLHESTHQFHHHLTSDAALNCFWYHEGLAEYFGMHNWDGKALQVGVVPALTLEDYPAKALAALAETERNFTGIVSARGKVEYAVAWSLVHFLLNRQPERFRKLAARLDRGDAPLEAWRDTFAQDQVPALLKDYRAWVEKHQQPWKIVWQSWQQFGAALEGSDPKVNALAVLKQTPERFAFEMERVQGTGPCGLVFGFRSDQDFYLLQYVNDKEARRLRFKDGKWVERKTFALPPRSGGLHQLAATVNDKQVALFVNGVRLETLPAPGQVGLNVDSCTARFYPLPGR
jgi:hypothetical protein